MLTKVRNLLVTFKLKSLRDTTYCFFFNGFDYNGVLFKTHGCSNIQQLHSSAFRAFFVQLGGRGKWGKGKEKLTHANIYKVIFFLN